MICLRLTCLSLFLFTCTFSVSAFAQCVCGEIQSAIRITNAQDSDGNFNPGDRIGNRGTAYLWNDEENENFFWMKVAFCPSSNDKQPAVGANYVITSIVDAGDKSWDDRLSIQTQNGCPNVVYSFPQLGWVLSHMEANPDNAVGLPDYHLDDDGYFLFHGIV